MSRRVSTLMPKRMTSDAAEGVSGEVRENVSKDDAVALTSLKPQRMTLSRLSEDDDTDDEEDVNPDDGEGDGGDAG